MKKRLAAATAATMLVLAACGGDDDSSNDEDSTAGADDSTATDNESTGETSDVDEGATPDQDPDGAQLSEAQQSMLDEMSSNGPPLDVVCAEALIAEVPDEDATVIIAPGSEFGDASSDSQDIVIDLMVECIAFDDLVGMLAAGPDADEECIRTELENVDLRDFMRSVFEEDATDAVQAVQACTTSG